MNKSLKEIYDEVKTSHTFDDFPVGTRVKIVTPCEDSHFFFGETGTVTENKGRYLGISVEYDVPRMYEDGYVQTGFNFNPQSLEIIEPIFKKQSQEYTSNNKTEYKPHTCPNCGHKF